MSTPISCVRQIPALLRSHQHPCNAAFASDLEGVIAQYQPPLWIHGHMHNRVDVALGETRVLCNPAGYNALANARHGYDPEFCIEIDAGGCAWRT